MVVALQNFASAMFHTSVMTHPLTGNDAMHTGIKWSSVLLVPVWACLCDVGVSEMSTLLVSASTLSVVVLNMGEKYRVGYCK